MDPVELEELLSYFSSSFEYFEMRREEAFSYQPKTEKQSKTKKTTELVVHWPCFISLMQKVSNEKLCEAENGLSCFNGELLPEYLCIAYN